MPKSVFFRLSLVAGLGVAACVVLSGLSAWAADEKPAAKAEGADAVKEPKPAAEKTDAEKKAEEAAKKKAAEEAKTKAAEEKAKLAEQKKKEAEKKRRENWEKYILETRLESYRKKHSTIARASDELKQLYTEMAQYDQVTDPKEKRKIEPKIRAVQGKIKRTKGTLDKELSKVVRPVKVNYDNLKQKDNDLQRRMDSTNDENQKRRLAEEQAKISGPIQGLEIELFMFEYFGRAGQPKPDEVEADQ